MAVSLLAAAGALPSAPTATEAAGLRRAAVVNDPDNPRGMQIRRARLAGESWADYFCAAYLWPYDAEYYNQVFATLNQNGRRIQFIGNVVFATDDRWYLVLRGTKESVTLMARNVVLESGGPNGMRLGPVETIIRADPAGNAWIGLVGFSRPAQPVPSIMSSFALYGNAGGVHEVLNEDQARRRFSVIRDILESIERIHAEELQKRH